jgi:hypothetical protein
MTVKSKGLAHRITSHLAKNVLRSPVRGLINYLKFQKKTNGYPRSENDFRNDQGGFFRRA